ncbi:shikimate dehydrogenase [Desulfolucanica intricata]|uniref:shikimate dehydrogenase n=1 Tax=Desulfolucanica intricata TaxID=1285191 RepID=UPI0008341DF5|nr:shikimate dehydrogenase [Desulfolucanica intricata]
MEKFAFMIHPLDISDMSRKFNFAKYLPGKLVEKAIRCLPAMKVSHITGVASAFNEAEGWFVACPLTARQMIELPEKYVIKRIIAAGRVAERLGAKILGLGAFTSVVGDAGITVANNLNISVTTGNSFTVATAIQGAKKAAELMGHNFQNSNIVIIGATGSIGKVCTQYLAREVKNLTLVARDIYKLEGLANKILYDYGLAVRVTSNVNKALRNADVIIAVTSAVDTIIGPEDLKPGAVICDVSRPRNVSRQVAEQRDDVLVIEGGVVEVPSEVEFNLDFGFPKGTAYACMAETMILALERRYESYTLGRELTLKQVEEIERLAEKHGFKVAGFRSFERAISNEEIKNIRNRANIKAAKQCSVNKINSSKKSLTK